MVDLLYFVVFIAFVYLGSAFCSFIINIFSEDEVTNSDEFVIRYNDVFKE